ncbi:MAG: hypothetical protein ACJAT2_002659 [Bacteriovoracaceae bacterium]|jgi:hypothetical protein
MGALKSSILAILLVSTSFANAGDVDAFSKRFELIKEEGKLIAIRDRSLSFKFSIKPYLKFIKETLLEEQRLMNSKADYNSELEELFAEEFHEKGDTNNQNIQYLVRSMEELKKIDVEKVFNDPGFKEVVEKFESKLGEAMLKLDPRVVARLDDPTFFYKRTVGYQAVKWALNFAKSRLSTIPVLNTASYIIVKVEKLIRERRLFHQNMMMHYFENFSETDLGMTHEEVNLTWSSIYESRIPWYAFWESTAAKENWNKYGVGKFFQGVRAANTRFRNYQSNYSRVGRRFNFAFRGATYKDEDVIVNMVDSQNQFNRKPAIAYYVHKPTKIKRTRIILQLAGLGVSFIPLPNFVKNIASNYFKSFYETQKISEGALYGYFESNGAKEDMAILRDQYLNPFDKLTLN